MLSFVLFGLSDIVAAIFIKYFKCLLLLTFKLNHHNTCIHRTLFKPISEMHSIKVHSKCIRALNRNALVKQEK